MTPDTKRRVITFGSVVVILASCLWIYFTQFRAITHNVELHRYIGSLMATQTVQIIGAKGKVMAIAIDPKEWPELKTQLDAYKLSLQALGHFDLREYQMDTKDQPKYGLGSGLSGRRFVRTVNKNTNTDIFVSFIGVPKVSKEESAELTRKPHFIAETRSVDNVAALFKKGLLDSAIVSRFQFPAPSREHPKTAQEWFLKKYQVVTVTNVSTLPASLSE